MIQNSGGIPNNFSATSAPTVNDDVDDGYLVGSHWYDTTNDKIYTCIDNSSGSAIWKSLGLGDTGLELIDSYTVTGSAVSEIAFSGISGNDYSEMILLVWLYNPDSSARTYSLIFQDDYSVSHYYEMYYYHVYGNNPTYGSANSADFQQLEAGEYGFVVFYGISRSADNRIRYFKDGLRNYGSNMVREGGTRTYTETVTEITDITIYQSGNYIGVGSKVLLYGRKV